MAMEKSEILRNLGPLAALAGTWEGVSGKDVAPSDDRGTEKNEYRERLTFVPFGPVDNHEQKLFGLRYSTVAWRLGEPDASAFVLSAEVGSKTYGICSNLFLDKEFRTVRYDLKVTLHENGECSYEEETQIQMAGQSEVFHHTDRNRLKRVELP